METNQEILDAKQCATIIIQNEHNPCSFRTYTQSNFNSNKNSVLNMYQAITAQQNIPLEPTNFEEPIDLTTFSNRRELEMQNIQGVFRHSENIRSINALKMSNESAMVNLCPLKRKIKQRFFNNGNITLVPNSSVPQNPMSFSPSKQSEVLKAAKSLFSKRTRTLYQWMYPNANKQQIANVISSSWESLGKNEKEFYVSQVLGRFGLTHTNLMINPQLDSIKELPQLLPKPPVTTFLSPSIVSPPISHISRIPGSAAHRSEYINRKELQTAVSSITPQNFTTSSIEDFEQYNRKRRKRRGRRKINNLQGSKCMLESNLPQDFQDDPELSQELEKFAIKFKLSKLGL